MTGAYVHLIGAEDVRGAGHAMRTAADDMRSAANTISEAVSELKRALQEHRDWEDARRTEVTGPSAVDLRVRAYHDKQHGPNAEPGPP